LLVILYRFRTDLDRDFDRCWLVVLVCLNSTILFSGSFFQHLLCGGSGSFSPWLFSLDGFQVVHIVEAKLLLDLDSYTLPFRVVFHGVYSWPYFSIYISGFIA
jgi:hypothetical protein